MIFSFLQKSEQFHLADRGKITDFVQKEGSARCSFDESGPLASSPGKGAGDMTKQGVGKQGLIQAGDIDRDHLSFTMACPVNGPGDEFLAHACLTGDQYRLPRSGNGLDIIENGNHRGGSGDDFCKVLRVLRLGCK